MKIKVIDLLNKIAKDRIEKVEKGGEEIER